jgi:hypothetical protein
VGRKKTSRYRGKKHLQTDSFSVNIVPTCRVGYRFVKSVGAPFGKTKQLMIFKVLFDLTRCGGFFHV